MKKTMIALAAVAAVGSVSAQVVITGGVDFTWGRTTAADTAASFAYNPATGGNTAVAGTNGAVSRGIAGTDAYIDIAATEDLGGGWAAKAFMEINADGAWGAGAYAGDHSFSLVGPIATLTAISTRSGGILNNIMLAPVVSPTDHWSAPNAIVMARGAVDSVALSGTVAQGLKMAYKFTEGSGGYATPTNLNHTIGAYYTMGAFGANYEYNARNYPDNISGDVRLVRHDLTGTFNAGFAQFALGYESGMFNTANNSEVGAGAGAFFASAKTAVGQTDLGINYGKRDNASFVEVGAQYNLSKTAFLVGSYGTFNFQNGTSSDSYGVRIGKSF